MKIIVRCTKCRRQLAEVNTKKKRIHAARDVEVVVDHFNHWTMLRCPTCGVFRHIQVKIVIASDDETLLDGGTPATGTNGA